MLRVMFKDEGQDFLEWDIEKGVVIACRPFQEWLWKGTKVHNRKIRPGDRLEISGADGVRKVMLHPVESIMAVVSEVKRNPVSMSEPEVVRNPA